MSHSNHKHEHDYLLKDEQIRKNEKRTLFVVVLTFLTMFLEIVAGHLTSSMALLADGWHMASHAGALFISFLAYRLGRSKSFNNKFSFGAGKMVPLGGYSSAILLGVIAVLMGYHSVMRLFEPLEIAYREAIIIASIGLLVNIASAFILSVGGHHHHHDEEGHHGHDHDHSKKHVHDHNLRSAYIHVIADALTSVFAIVALIFGSLYGAAWLDPVMGIVGSIIILKWAYNLCRDTVWELLDGHPSSIDRDKIREHVEEKGVEVSDLHVWRVAPKAYACELVVTSSEQRGTEVFRELLVRRFGFENVVVEERICKHVG